MKTTKTWTTKTWTVWAKDEAGKVVEMQGRMSYEAAKAYRAELETLNILKGRMFTFLPGGDHPRRMGW